LSSIYTIRKISGGSAMTVETKVNTAQAAQIMKPKSGLQLGSAEIKNPDNTMVRLKIEACGICHSDSIAFEGLFPNIKYPIVPGHEIVGIVDAIGPNVSRLKKGDRVGVGWHGGHCGICASCRSGDFITCEKLQTPGITFDGGYAEYGLFPENACAMVPKNMDAAEAAPLLCAGVTTFNALRHSGARGGDLVVVLGIGGLGHLGVQFASKMGFHTVAIARGKDKRDMAMKLGAAEYIDSQSQDIVAEIKKLGGAKVVLATVTQSEAMSPLIDALAVDGKLLIVGAGFESLTVTPIQLLMARRSIVGWPSGTAKDSEECMQFCSQTGIRPMIERFPFKDASAGYERMMSGKARFRAVLEF
jgi:D-arabinose 1-dehydrogenase-like Zn-dependent alcohol dehydrogenase